MAQAFGKTWWGRQWLNSLNNIDFENRLPRGSSYARKGAVTTIDINGNQINAKVSGSRPRPYNVTITLPPFDDFALNAFIDRLTQQPAVISKLLNRELAPEVLELSKKMGLEVFPRQWSDLKMTCSCPDWAVPCKHLAAVIYKVSTAIDNDPFLVFSLHNIDLVNELNRRQVFVTKENTAIPFIADLYFEEPKKKSKPAVYNPENAYRKLSYAALKPLHEPLIALLADYPVFYPGGGNFRDKYAACLVRSVKKAQKILQGKASLEVAAGKAPKSEPSIDTHSQPEIVVNEKLRPSALINGTAVSLPDLLVQLLQIPAAGIPDYQPATAFLHTTLYLALHLLANGGVVPQIVQQPDHNFSIRWLPAMLSEPVRVLITQLQEMQPPGIFRLQESSKQVAINKDTAINLLAVFLTDLVAMLQEKDTDDLLLDLFFSRASHAFKAPAEATLSGGIQAWLQKYYLTAAAYKPQVVVEETTAERFSISINISDKNKPLQGHMPLQEILSGNKFARQRFQVLQSLTQLSGFINGLDAYINEGADTPIVMDNAAFTTFLLQMIPAIQLLDIDVLLPKALQQVLKPQPSIKLTAQKGKSFLRLDELLDFDWQIAIGDTLLNEAEFKQLLRRSDTLIKYKSQYIYVSKAELEKLHTHFSAAKKLSGFQLLRAALSSDYYGAKVNMTGEVRDLIKTLTQVQEVPLPAGIHAQLRPYQQRGYSWLYRNAQIGFGSVIADDMGLGKTLQVITTLLKYKEEGLL
ncbi:MAG TPA: SNF2 helicase-associated domain-containing protein, partial [Chitinophaga sp.]|uniref:SNF2 helicase-associated domain-containing protein n=1 Tax=Chitinophaga sp. TaxID=1869181 RepID=UPI002DBAD1A7